MADLRFDLRVTQRAYISVTPTEIIDFGERLKPAIAVRIHNEGNTPAYKARCWSAIAVVSAPVPKEFPQQSFGPEFTLMQKANLILSPRIDRYSLAN
jgi:hypothetical protein